MPTADPDSADLDDPATDPFEVARLAAGTLAQLTGAPRHDVALVLGSGWGPAGDLLGETLATVDNADVPGFHGAAVATIVAGRVVYRREEALTAKS